jgi:hypothetical protein
MYFLFSSSGVIRNCKHLVTVYIGQTKRISQTQQCSVTKQYYIILVGLHVSILPESSSGPQDTELEGLKITQVELEHVALLI